MFCSCKPWIFWHHGPFSSGTFWHMDISSQKHRCRNVGAKMSVPKCTYCFVRCRNIHLPKYPLPKSPWCQKFLVSNCTHAKKSFCWNLHGNLSMEMKFPCACISAESKYPCNKMYSWWNLSVDMSLSKMSGSLMVGSHKYKTPLSVNSETGS